MTRDELLTRLAMELIDWPSAGEFDSYKFVGEKLVSQNATFPIQAVDTFCTRAEWLAERERLIKQRPAPTTSLGASEWDEDRIDIIGSNGNDGLAYSAPAWDGEGLPSVGMECEAVWLEPPDGGGRDFEPVLIKGIHWLGNSRAQVWFCTAEGEEFVMLEGNCDFRPMPSDEDKAVEHMKSVAGTSYVRPEHMEMITRALYRAGYRKMEAAQ